jgi:hypothetical protein
MKRQERDQSASAVPRKQPRPGAAAEAEEIILRGYTGPGSKEMMMLWPAFVVIHEHYFPRSLITRARRSLHLVPGLDYSRSNAGMKKFLGDAARTLRTNRGKWAELLAEPAPAWLAELRRLAFQQFQDELQTIATFGEAVEAMRAGDNALRRQSLARVRYLMECCRTNRERLSDLAMTSWYKDPTEGRT